MEIALSDVALGGNKLSAGPPEDPSKSRDAIEIYQRALCFEAFPSINRFHIQITKSPWESAAEE